MDAKTFIRKVNHRLYVKKMILNRVNLKHIYLKITFQSCRSLKFFI